MEIRKMTAEDAAEYWELRLEALKNNGEAFLTTYEEAVSRQDPITQVKNNLSSSGSITYGAMVEGKLAGNLTVLFNQHKKMAHKASIVGMYVTPSARNLGMGRALLEIAEEAAKVEGIEILQLTVVTTNTSALKLYERSGYVSYGVEKHAMKSNGEYIDEMLMNKNIRPES